MSTWPNRGASGGPCGGLEERKTEANAVRPTRSDSSQQASSKPGAVHGMQSRIFDLFVQDARASDRSEGGLGIGLALVRHLVDLHGGAIEATSEGEGKGTEFVVRLPLLLEAPVPAQEAVHSSESATGRIMVVDDDAEAGESMSILLRLYGYDVECANDLKSALQIGQDFRPQVVLMDLSMPQADGYQVARRLRAITEVGRQVTYVALTGLSQPDDFRRSKQEGFAHHLVKPVDPEKLNQLLKQALQGPGDANGHFSPAT